MKFLTMNRTISWLTTLVLALTVFLLGSTSAYYTAPSGFVKGHNFMFKKAVDYINQKDTSPAKGFPLEQYLPDLVYGSWYADHYDDTTEKGSDDCEWPFDKVYRCDQIHHYGQVGRDIEGKWWEFGAVIGNTGELAAPNYSNILFEEAIKFWPGGVKPELNRLPRLYAGTMDATSFHELEDLGYTWAGSDPISRKRENPMWPVWARSDSSPQDAIESESNAMKYLGWAIHMMQDVTEPHNAVNVASDRSDRFEEDIDSLIEAGAFADYPIMRTTGTYDNDPLESPIFNPGDYTDMQALTDEAIRQTTVLKNIARRRLYHHRIMDMTIKMTARSIEMFFEELAWAGGQLHRGGISANPSHCWTREHNLRSPGTCDSTNAVACVDGPFGHDAFGCLYHSECEAWQYGYSGCVAIESCNEPPANTFCSGDFLGPIWCGRDHQCKFASTCFAEAAGYDIEADCSVPCKEAPASTLCGGDFPGPVWCGLKDECKFSSTCFAEAAGYNIELDCQELILPGGTKTWKKVHGPTRDVYAGEDKVYVVSETDGHIYEQTGTTWKDLGGVDCQMFAVSGLRLYCLTSSDGIKIMSYSGDISGGPSDWFFMNDPEIHSQANYIVAADYIEEIAAMMDTPFAFCGGHADIPCESDLTCVDNLADSCDARTGVYCGGICIDEASENDGSVCGGFAGIVCDPGFMCVDNPLDDCNPKSDVDCDGFCVEYGIASGIYKYVEPSEYPSGPEAWVNLAGEANRLTMDKYTGTLYLISTWGGVYQHISGTQWTQISEGEFEEVYAANDKVYAVHQATHDIYYYSGANRMWDKVGDPASIVSIDRCGILYQLSLDRSGVYEKNATGTEWTPIGGPAGKIFAGGCGQLFATNPDSLDLYQYDEW